MAIKATAKVASMSTYDATNNYIEVRIVAERNGQQDQTNELFVIPISANANEDLRDAIKSWLTSNWGVSFGLLDTVQLWGGAALL